MLPNEEIVVRLLGLRISNLKEDDKVTELKLLKQGVKPINAYFIANNDKEQPKMILNYTINNNQDDNSSPKKEKDPPKIIVVPNKKRKINDDNHNLIVFEVVSS
jgi:hypothetical protein